MARHRVWVLLLLVSCLSLGAGAGVSNSDKNLAPRYRHWLTVEVPYIIESEERTEFLGLHTDTERDNFIREFWDSRNPNPGSDLNSYKEEHYRRLQYANEHFGDPKNENGWRTDQGRIYITLGEPQQHMTYPQSRNVRPLIVWFYRAPSPALPPYFYVVFYKRSIGEPYTLYSPYQDGPARLATGLEALNDQTRALQQVRKAMGDEVARETVSLLPGEPVDLDNFSPSMTSDVLLSTIRGLPDNYLERQKVALNRGRSKEKVTASIFGGGDAPTVGYTVTRDAQGQSTVNYLIKFAAPDAALIGERKDKSLGYDLTLQNHIRTESGRPVYDDVVAITGPVGAPQAALGRKKIFAAEDRLPLVPGTYVVESTLTNNLNLQAHKMAQKVVVPEPRSAVLGISEPVIYSGNPVREGEGSGVPFSFADLRFSPRAVHEVSIHAGDRIPCVFQLWLPKTAAGVLQSAPVQMHYLYGSASLNQKPVEESDETVEATNADAAGNLITGHVFQTSALALGSYRMVIRATQAGSPPAYAALTIHVVPDDVPVDSWSAYGPPEPAQDQAKRELAAKAQGKADQGRVAPPTRPQ